MGTSILLLAAAATMTRTPWTLTSPNHGRVPTFAAAQQTQQSWSGFLMDDGCHAASATSRCEVTDDTKDFGIQTSDGKYYKLDSPDKVRAALKAAAGKSAAGGTRVTVTGSADGNAAIKVAAIQVL